MKLTAKGKILRVKIEYRDPWTDEFCAGADLVYTKQRAATCFYSRFAKRLKIGARQYTGPRTPKLYVNIIRGAA